MPAKSSYTESLEQRTNAFHKYSVGDLGFLVSVLLLTFLVFYPSLYNDFVNWDDDINLLDNPNLTVFNWDAIVGIFSSTIIGNYNPLPIFTFALERHFFGLDPFVFHLNNLLLHLGSVGLVYMIANRVGCTGIGAAIAAAIFAIHPMHVESVAWVSQRKDVLYGFFFLAACYAYLQYLGNEKKGKYLILVYLFFILSCLSKIQAVALPLVLIGLDFLLEKNWKVIMLKDKLGFLLISLTVGLFGIFALNNYGSLDGITFSIIERLAIGAYSFCTYIYKFFLPYHLSAIYAYPTQVSIYYYVCLIPFLAFLYLLYWSFKKNRKYLFFTCWIFFSNIIFVLQFLGAGQAFLADRFSYLSYIGLALGVGYLINKFIVQFPKWRLSIYTVPIFVLLLFANKSIQQSKIWNNSETLWSNAIDLQADAHLAYHNRGLFYSQIKSEDLALADLTKAIRIAPTNANYYNSRATAYINQGLTTLALNDYNQAILMSRKKATFFNHRSVAHAMQGNYQAGLKDLNQAIDHNPLLAEAYLNRALLFAHTQNFEAALNDNLTYLEFFPKAQDIWVEAGMNARIIGKKEAASEYLNHAINLNPNDPNAQEELALLK